MPEEKRFVFSGPKARLDKFLADRLAPLSRTRVQKLIESDIVFVNGRTEPGRRLLEDGDVVTVTLPEFAALPAAAEGRIPVLHEDPALIVVDKPADIVVHPAGPHRQGTLVQRLWPKLAPAWDKTVRAQGGAFDRPGVVHRLDKGTSGVMVLAKTPHAAENLSRQFAERTVKKTYWALVRGIPRTDSGRIQSVVGRSRRHPGRMTVKEEGRWSETDFKVLERYPSSQTALLELHPLTGRTHQIRVQLAALGHPVVGDALYGDTAASQEARPLLHARSLEFTHPARKRRMTFQAEPPKDFLLFMRRQKKIGRPPHARRNRTDR